MPPTLEDEHQHFSPAIHDVYSHNTPAAHNFTAEWYDNSAPEALAPKSSTRTKAPPQDIESLRALPEVRLIPWKQGKECAPAQSTESSRPQTRGAFMLATRGKTRSPCTHCQTGAGRFSACVSLNDFYHGACATCVMATRGNKCSLRQDVEEGYPPSNTEQPEPLRLISPDEDESYSQIPSSKRKRSPPRAYVAGCKKETGEVQHAEKGADEHQDQKLSQAATNTETYPNAHSTHYSPGNTPQAVYQYSSAALQATGYQTPTDPTPLPQDLLPNDKAAFLEYVYQKQYPPNGTKRCQILRHTGRESSQSVSGPAGYKRVRLGTELDDRGEASSSMSPSVPQVQTVTRYRSSGDGAALRSEADSTAFIDTLPKKKRRELFSIIGGLQSGIRLVQQQTDGMQKQLDLLQAALGFDMEDSDEAT